MIEEEISLPFADKDNIYYNKNLEKWNFIKKYCINTEDPSFNFGNFIKFLLVINKETQEELLKALGSPQKIMKNQGGNSGDDTSEKDQQNFTNPQGLKTLIQKTNNLLKGRDIAIKALQTKLPQVDQSWIKKYFDKITFP